MTASACEPAVLVPEAAVHDGMADWGLAAFAGLQVMGDGAWQDETHACMPHKWISRGFGLERMKMHAAACLLLAEMQGYNAHAPPYLECWSSSI